MREQIQRREFLQRVGKCAAALGLCPIGNASTGTGEHERLIVDSHIHLFDPTRPGGVPWPEKDDVSLYRPALPERYEALSTHFGIVGCIAIEASPWASDNDWLLNTAREHSLVLGVVGNLVPGTSTYASELDRLHKSPLFLGIRYGNLWTRDLGADLDKPGFTDGLKALAQAGLVFESANPDPPLIRALLHVADRVDNLRMIVDHLPNAKLPPETVALKAFYDDLHALASHPMVFIKLSEIPVVRDGTLIRDPAFYREHLDILWNLFGEDRVIFGSDWPNSDHIAPFSDTLGIVRRYMTEKSQSAQEKYFWRNSATIYRWQPRRSDQPRLS